MQALYYLYLIKLNYLPRYVLRQAVNSDFEFTNAAF